VLLRCFSRALRPRFVAADGVHPLIVADGYHRVCASYYTDENTDIPVRIVPATK